MSEEKKNQLKAEVQYIFDNSIAEPCPSNWELPYFLVKKAASTDCCKVNILIKAKLCTLLEWKTIDHVGLV